MKNTLISTLSLLLTSLYVLPSYGSSLRGQDISHAYLTNSTFVFDYANMQDLVVFGDAYSDVNLNLDNMKYDDKINGGKNWALKLVDIPDHKYWLWDFARSGAVIDQSIVPRPEEDSNFLSQFSNFYDNLYSKNTVRGWSSRSTLFAIWFGTNDIIYMNRNQGNSTNEILDSIVDSLFQKADILYNHGARHFLFIYVPTIERSPLGKNGSLNFTNSDITYFNTQVKNHGRDFFNTYPDINVLIYDAYMEFQYIMDNKEKYGIDNINDSCENSGNSNCGTTDENFFWHNDIRPSYRVHEALGRDIHDFLSSKQVTRDLRYKDSAAFNLKINFKSLLLCNAIILLTLLFL
ncbi:hypothetical protein H8356DRAFT_1623987 [Neocallimastix lanati (nom. inval.)]|jgi:phospholipase/lecithinase/hemolysin|uniref:Carbohydrate esterase family 16 protein n=1 Tax=Neocallimastix californiae TaxID=1754190 RepID=A0A1Y2E5I8_9FUNG|nr:hypothetical protein H8356DRAFT_1623987 [Neocallimastix sp. JGI-2020a]ORY66833.1 hypothetical protein LY90DRAFT_453291 [Neocallimastix californiae]|eukprot:ORY66833.1 hypothetical protein LY90DRAFT_453291 [Neocallimastix californiae]